ncbi:MAG: leucine-rich repeat protein [Bacilli bacterium]|nr:leucine-rich repeat protein [Bacilli bacterium]
MKKLNIFIILLLGVLLVPNVYASTIKETTESDNYDTIETNTTIIGVTKFTQDEIITALKATTAGANDARLYIKINGNDDEYETPKIYIYYGKIGGWYSLDLNNQVEYISDENLINQLSNLDIYYVNNVEKKIEITIPYDNIDISKLQDGIEYDNGKLIVNATIDKFTITTLDNRNIYYEFDKNSETFIENESSCFTVDNGYITDYDSLCKNILTIPTTLNNQNIVGISINAFNNKGIKEVTIPGQIMNIGSNAFANNPLEKVVIENKYDSSDFTYFGENAFGTFTDIYYHNDLSEALSNIPDTLNVKASNKYSGEFGPLTVEASDDVFVKFGISKIVKDKQLGICFEGLCSSYWKYELLEDSKVEITISNSNKSVSKIINYSINYVDTEEFDGNDIKDEVDRLNSLIKNKIINEKKYDTITKYDINDATSKFGFNGLKEETPWACGDIYIPDFNKEFDFFDTNHKDECYASPYYIYKDDILYATLDLQPGYFSFHYNISMNFYEYDTPRDIVDTGLDLFDSKIGLKNYEVDEEALQYELDHEPISEIKNGKIIKWYSFSIKDKNTGNVWYVSLVDLKNGTSTVDRINIDENFYLTYYFSLDEYIFNNDIKAEEAYNKLNKINIPKGLKYSFELKDNTISVTAGYINFQDMSVFGNDYKISRDTTFSNIDSILKDANDIVKRGDTLSNVKLLDELVCHDFQLTCVDENDELITDGYVSYGSKTRESVKAGDIIKIDKEEFYVIDNDRTNDKIKMISVYNLKVGDIYDSEGNKIGSYTNNDDGYGRQSSEANGRVRDANANVNGVVTFSDINYWNEKVGEGLEYEGEYCTYTGDTNCANVYDSNSNLYQYIESYRNYLTNLGVEIDEARLMTLEEKTNFNSLVGTSSYLNQTSFWLATPTSSTGIWAVGFSGIFDGESSYDSISCGVRPLIIF